MAWDRLGGIRRSPLDRARRQANSAPLGQQPPVGNIKSAAPNSAFAQAPAMSPGGAFQWPQAPHGQHTGWQQTDSGFSQQTAPAVGQYAPGRAQSMQPPSYGTPYGGQRPSGIFAQGTDPGYAASNPDTPTYQQQNRYAPFAPQPVIQQYPDVVSGFGDGPYMPPQQPQQAPSLPQFDAGMGGYSPGRAQPIPPPSYGEPYGQTATSATAGPAAGAGGQGPGAPAYGDWGDTPPAMFNGQTILTDFRSPMYQRMSDQEKNRAWKLYSDYASQSANASRARDAASPHGQAQVRNRAAMQKRADDRNDALAQIRLAMNKLESMGSARWNSDAGRQLSDDIWAMQEEATNKYGIKAF